MTSVHICAMPPAKLLRDRSRRPRSSTWPHPVHKASSPWFTCVSHVFSNNLQHTPTLPASSARSGSPSRLKRDLGQLIKATALQTKIERLRAWKSTDSQGFGHSNFTDLSKHLAGLIPIYYCCESSVSASYSYVWRIPSRLLVGWTSMPSAPNCFTFFLPFEECYIFCSALVWQHSIWSGHS